MLSLLIWLPHLVCLVMVLPNSTSKTSEHPTLVIVEGVLGLAGAIAGLPAAIGVLMRRKWGRSLCLLAAAIAGILGIVVSFDGTFLGALYPLYAGWIVTVMIRRKKEFE